jgi:hypothetical protein
MKWEQARGPSQSKKEEQEEKQLKNRTVAVFIQCYLL